MSFEDRVRERWKTFQLGGERDGGAPDAESSAPETGAAEPAAREPAGTFIGSGALFEGTLRLKGDFCIESEFRGALTTDGSVVVGPAGSVQGDIHAREVLVQGAVVGNITARRQLVLRASARVHGDVETACLEIERHAFFQGRAKMTRPQSDPRPTPPAEAVAPVIGPPPV
jgi:cytoskeletal protein CcmA (bactofilin family)